MSEEIPPGISADDWAATPPAVKALVLSLLETVAALQKRVAELEERVNQNSRNSSKPPSSDPPHAPPRPKAPPSGRKAGGQPGHAGHGRSLKPVAQVDHVVVARPIQCVACGALLLGEDAQPVRHQVTELPRIKPEVTEYQRHTVTCLACGAHTQAPWPTEMPAGSFGPRAQATVGYLTGRLGVSQRDTEELLETLFHTDLGLGSVPALEQDVSAAVAQPVAEAQTYVQTQPVKNVDETSWPERAQRGWLWVTATPLVTVFLLLMSRGADSAKKVVGAAFQGIVGSDRWSGYNWLSPARRQVCWAHLKRDFQAFVERGGEAERIGRALLSCVEQIFGLWHRVRDGPLTRGDFQAAMQPIQARVGELLREGAQLSNEKTGRTCAKILKLEVALWTFVRVEGVEPTNNSAERPLRRAVLWRRRSFWTQSADGSRFVERILTVVTTLRQQKRDVLDYLTEACAAAIRGDQPPSLLPQPAAIEAVT
ncbi:MAG: IS66 family transposase [candidate division KSB1 bacterium]|nr:IS66 family transposase [candidate division KSB1 bacterium]